MNRITNNQLAEIIGVQEHDGVAASDSFLLGRAYATARAGRRDALAAAIANECGARGFEMPTICFDGSGMYVQMGAISVPCDHISGEMAAEQVETLSSKLDACATGVMSAITGCHDERTIQLAESIAILIDVARALDARDLACHTGTCARCGKRATQPNVQEIKEDSA